MGGTRQFAFLGGIIAVLLGLLWAGQGSGIVPFPASSPMIDKSQWIWFGVLLALAGLAAIWWARKQ